jgi:hypothetical protein
MSHRTCCTLAAALLLCAPAPARAAVQLVLTVEGPRGPFAAGDVAATGAMRIASLQLDLVPGGPAPRPPVVVVRRTDSISWQFMEALSSGDALRVVIVTTQSDQGGVIRHRRVVTLSGARVVSMHAAADASDDAASGLGAETIAFADERLEVEDDGTRVFSSGS